MTITSSLLVAATGVAAGAVLLCNLPAWFVPSPKLASLNYLAAAKLQTLDGSGKTFLEARELSSLRPVMDAHGVDLHAVVHETLGAEEFKPFLQGDVYLDPKHTLYGPQERWVSVFEAFSFEAIRNYMKIKNPASGNLQGEGRLMGAVYVVGPGEQGVLFQHHEKTFGDHADLGLVKAAIEQIQADQNSSGAEN